MQEEDDQNNSETNESTGEIENVRVVVRVRPMDKVELDAGAENVVKVDKANRCVTVIKPNAPVTEPPKVYYFDNVFGEDSTQVRIFIYSHIEFCAITIAYSSANTDTYAYFDCCKLFCQYCYCREHNKNKQTLMQYYRFYHVECV